jgi:extracellular factor (EF) 3-hydroxypalmitic acid methyl ester biosynthesis protein
VYHERFFDQTLAMIEQGHLVGGMSVLAGKLFSAHSDPLVWSDARTAFHNHPLHRFLLEDPYTAHCTRKPRGYAGDAELIDMIYSLQPPADTSEVGRKIFDVTIRFPVSEAVRLRRHYAETVVTSAWQAGKRICSLACGHFREGAPLIGEDASNITLVDQDPLSLDVVRTNHGASVNIHEANVFRYLRSAASRGEQFDLIYTLGLTDYLDTRSMQLLHKLMKACLAPGGTVLLANFRPAHLATGWMDAVMDWHLIYREGAELEGYAKEIGLPAKSWNDSTGSVVWCEIGPQP